MIYEQEVPSLLEVLSYEMSLLRQKNVKLAIELPRLPQKNLAAAAYFIFQSFIYRLDSRTGINRRVSGENVI